MNAIKHIGTFENELATHANSGDVDGIRRMIVSSAGALADLFADAEQHQAFAACDTAIAVTHTLQRAVIILRELVKP